MAVLCMQLAAPVQSWGLGDDFDNRGTKSEPTKSGVLGILCAALGLPRDEMPEHLVNLSMGVRVDREGVPIEDLQVVGGGNLPDGSPYGVHYANGVKLTKNNAQKRTVFRHKLYLCDAVFFVCLEDRRPNGVRHLTELLDALDRPHYPLTLGRRNCLPSRPIGLYVDKRDMEVVLEEHPWIAERRNAIAPDELRLIEETTPSMGDRRVDQPVVGNKREFGVRFIRESFIQTPEEHACY